MLECPASLIIVNASVPASPNRVRHVCRRECNTNSLGKRYFLFFPVPGRQTLACICAKLVPRSGFLGESPGNIHTFKYLLSANQTTNVKCCIQEKTELKPLFSTAIYVNRASASLPRAIEGKAISDQLTENRPWTSGERLLDKAREAGCDLPLIFAQFAKLEYWAVAEEINVAEERGEKMTHYRFSNLQRISGSTRQRNDLIVISTGKPLPNEYIRSYVFVKTPAFLHQKPGKKPH
jgi:hypothetical protein